MSIDRATVLDFGSSKAACIIASLDVQGDLQVLGAACTPCEAVRKGALVDVEAAAAAAGKVIAEVERQTETRVEHVSVALSGAGLDATRAQGYVPIFPRTRPISRDDVLQVLKHSRDAVFDGEREPIQAIPVEFRVDGRSVVRRPLGMTGSRLEVTTYFVTGEPGTVANAERAVRETGREIDQFILGSLGAGTAVLSPEDIELGAAVVDIGAGTTEVAVFQNGAICHSASVPVGGNLVSSDVAKLLKTSPQEAESLKLKYGAALAELVGDDATIDVLQLGQIERRPMKHKVFLEIIEARMAEIAKLVRQQIERSGNLGSLHGGVTLTGGGSLMPAATDLFQRVLQHPKVRTVRPDLEGPYGELASRPSMATCVGSALFLLESCTDELGTDGDGATVGGRIRSFFANLGGR